MDKLREACGVFGIYGNFEDKDISRTVFYGLYALQHRGQESAGIAVTSGNGIKYHKGMGLVSEVFGDRILDGLSGRVALGHVRYATSDTNTLINAQPLVVRYKKGSLAVAHNGNLVNAMELRKELEDDGIAFQTEIDSEVVAFLISRYHDEDILEAVKICRKKIRGSYAFIIMTEDKLIGMRDPHGIRPLCLGKIEDCYVLSSESCALDTVDGEFIRDVEPGEIVVIDKDGVKSIKNDEDKKASLCVFEFVYFARPDSTIDGRNIHMARWEAGKRLAIEHPVDADLVIGVPDSGTAAGLGFADQSGIPFANGLMKNRYVGRTFIKPSQDLRLIGVKIKLNAVKEVVGGKRVVMVDDSIVRGTTSGQIVKMLREAGAKEVHVRVSSPPVMKSCYFGIDTSTQKELIGAQREISEIQEHIGADSLGYLSLQGLMDSTGILDNTFCTGCFSGKFPIEVPMENRGHRYEKR